MDDVIRKRMGFDLLRCGTVIAKLRLNWPMWCLSEVSNYLKGSDYQAGGRGQS